MRKSVFLACILGLVGTLCLSGCFVIDRGQLLRTNEEHILVSNYGWYLFDVLPLACGNAAEERALPFVFFRNDVTMDKIQTRFMTYAESYGRRAGVGVNVRDLAYTTRESVLFEIPGINFPIPLPYILTYREIQLSGVLDRVPEKALADDQEVGK